MKRFRLTLLLLIVCAGTLRVSAQTDYFNLLNRDNYLAKVKLLDEFISRFNGEELRHDMGEKYADREAGILLLFDLSKFKSQADEGFLAAKQFASDAVRDSISLHFEDEAWFARVKCSGQLSGKKVSFKVILGVEERDSGIFCWAIRDVEGDLFKTSRDKAHKEFFLMPNENEQFFMSLPRITQDKPTFIDDYARSDYKADRLSTFLALVRNKLLRIDNVADIEFVFEQVPAYTFTVKYFEREGKNAGWLIDSCKKTEVSSESIRMNAADTLSAEGQIARQFLENLQKWNSTKDIDYLIEAKSLCAENFRVSGEIITRLDENHETLDIDYRIDTYLHCLQNSMKNGGIQISVSDIITLPNITIKDSSPAIEITPVVYTIHIEGAIEYQSTDVLFVKGDKIVKMSPYSSIIP